MKKLILAVSLLLANMVQASDTPAHLFDTRPTYRFHPNQHGFHLPHHFRSTRFHGMNSIRSFPTGFNAPVSITIPDFKTADEEMIVGAEEMVLINVPDFKQADQEMRIAESEMVLICLPDLRNGESEMLEPFDATENITVPNFIQADLEMMLQ
jgi:hypothetical protein